MTFDWKITFGDVLTVVSILISVWTLVNSWRKDRLLRQRELADKVRAAAAKTLTKLERWEELSLALFFECQPFFVKVSEDLAKKFDIVAARDFLWRELNSVYLKIMANIRAEEIETAYADLYVYHPEARKMFHESLLHLKSEHEQAFTELLAKTQDAIMAFDGEKKKYQTAELGNALRAAAKQVRERYSQALNQKMKTPQKFLFDLIAQSDETMLAKKSS